MNHQLPDYVLSSRLSPLSKLVFSILYLHLYEQDELIISNFDIALKVNISTRIVSRCIRELKKFYLIDSIGYGFNRKIIKGLAFYSGNIVPMSLIFKR